MHLLPGLACYITVLCGTCVWLIGLSVSSVPALPSAPGCDYPSQKNCGLSVGVSRAEYCLNRNSCAALYPDVANRVCECVFEVDEGVCAGVLDWLGHVVELSWSPLRHGVDYYLPLLKYGEDAECVLSLSARKIMNMQKKKKKKKKKWSQTRYQLKG